MTEFRIPRHHDVPLVFDGELLAERSSHEPGLPRWLETRIYRTASGRYVTEMIGRSTIRGEEDKITVKVHDSASQVRTGFTRIRTYGPFKGETYLTIQAEETIAEAADYDPALDDALVDRI